jgi:hypothetical protein
MEMSSVEKKKRAVSKMPTASGSHFKNPQLF